MADNATVELRADNTKLKRELDEGEGAVRRWGGSVQGVIQTLAAALAAYKLFDWGKSLISAAADDELSVRRLEATLKATGSTIGVTAEQINQLAVELQRTTRFGDDATRGAATMLTAFGNIRGDNMVKTIRTAADLAELLGSDLPSAAAQLGRVLSQPEQGLGFLERRIGSLTKAQEAQIKSFIEMGDVASAQEVILQAVTDKVGGLATELGDTTAGKIARFKNDLGDLGEVIGMQLIGALEDLGGKGRSAFDILNASIQNWGKTWDMIVKGATLSIVRFWETFKHFATEQLPAIAQEVLKSLDPRNVEKFSMGTAPNRPGIPFGEGVTPEQQLEAIDTFKRNRPKPFELPTREKSALEKALELELSISASKWAEAVDSFNAPGEVDASAPAGSGVPAFGNFWKGIGKQWGDLSKAFKDKKGTDKAEQRSAIEDLVSLHARISGAAAGSTPEARAAKAAEQIKERMDEAREAQQVVGKFVGDIKHSTKLTATATMDLLKKTFGFR